MTLISVSKIYFLLIFLANQYTPLYKNTQTPVLIALLPEASRFIKPPLIQRIKKNVALKTSRVFRIDISMCLFLD